MADIPVDGATGLAEVDGGPDFVWFSSIVGATGSAQASATASANPWVRLLRPLFAVTASSQASADGMLVRLLDGATGGLEVSGTTGFTWEEAGRSFVGATAGAQAVAQGSYGVRAPIRIQWITAMLVGRGNVASLVASDVRPGESATFPLVPLQLGTSVAAQVQTSISLNFETVQTLWARFMFAVNARMRAEVVAETGGYYPAIVSMWRGNNESDMQQVVYPTESDYLIFVPGVLYLMKIDKIGSADHMARLNLVIDPPLFFGTLYAADLDRAPGLVSIVGDGFRVRTPVTVSLVGYPDSQVVTADEFGYFEAQFSLETDVGVGTYVLNATDGSGTATTSFIVKYPAYSDNGWPDDDLPAIPPLVTTEWVLQDPLGDLETFVFPYNPARMSSPHAPVNYYFEATVAQDGQPVVYEGGDAAFEWTFAGISDTQDWHDALIEYASLGHRVWLQDHRGRVWTVSIVRVEFTPHRKTGWLMDYTVTALIHDVIAPAGTP